MPSRALAVGLFAALVLAACGAPEHEEDDASAPGGDAGIDAGAEGLDASVLDDGAIPPDGDAPDAAPDASSGACSTDSDCDDGLFCNGDEICAREGAVRYCLSSAAPRCYWGCDEEADRCCPDDDGDGFAAIGCGAGVDCDDADASVHPYQTELCGGGERDCDLATLGDDGDDDGDGHTRADCCQIRAGGEVCGDDCDDREGRVHAGADEACNGRDDDCDGAIDEGLEPADRPIRADCDSDGYGDPSRGTLGCWPSSGWGPIACPWAWWSSEEALDCDDDAHDVRPDYYEQCDGRDEDCDGAIDRTVRDSDGDGFDAFACDGTGDCDDWNPDRYPGAPELCNGVDDDCDGSGEDADGDGHAAIDAPCTGGTLSRDDCDDRRYATRPGGWEACNGIDDDCDGVVDGLDAYCDRRRAWRTECRDAVCLETECVPGWGACTEPFRCTTETAVDEAHCGACGARCASSACLSGACAAFDALALSSWQTVALVGQRALLIAPTGALPLTEYPSVEVSAIGGGARACFVWPTGRIHCTGGWAPSNLTVPGALEVASAEDFACARASDGHVWCWGRGPGGELGDGTSRGTAAGPIEVSGVADATSIAVGARSACAMRATGAVVCWGNGYYGTLGDGTTRTLSGPVEVALPVPAVAIASGDWHACAISEDHELWCWGWNARGQLGEGALGAIVPAPARVPGAGRVVAVAAAGDSTCAVGEHGALSCWGANDAGQLGDGTREDRVAPVTIASSVDRIWMAREHACSRAQDGAIACWGENSDGRLGDGTRTDSLRPVLLDYSP